MDNELTSLQTEPLGLSWFSIFRLALVQACLGGIVVLTTSTLNRVMVVELGLAAAIPGALVAWHYVLQFLRPKVGYLSDQGYALTRLILGGMTILALGGFCAAASTALMAHSSTYGLLCALISFSLIGIGVSASGTSLLILLARNVRAQRRAPAATMVWTTMIFGFALTAGLAGKFLDPFSFDRLLRVSGAVSVIALGVAFIALWGVERRANDIRNAEGRVQRESPNTREKAQPKVSFSEQLSDVWREPQARAFTIFIFVSMLSFNAQDLILEPFAAQAFQLSPGQTTQLSGAQHAGVMLGMLLVALCCSPMGRQLFGLPGLKWLGLVGLNSLRFWLVGGCIGSAAMMMGLVHSSLGLAATSSLIDLSDQGLYVPIRINVFLLGLANGAFSIAAISSMFKLALVEPESDSKVERSGTRMGVWGAAQALAFGFGGLLGAVLSDFGRILFDNVGFGYALVFSLEVCGFLLAAWVAWRLQNDALIAQSLELQLEA